MSATKLCQPSVADNDIKHVLPNLDKVGDVESRDPARASGSRKPWVIKRAFARGLPSGCFDHLRMKCALSTRWSVVQVGELAYLIGEEAFQLLALGFNEGNPV